MKKEPLDPFTGESYLNLATLRKNGKEVHTPVWFVQENGLLFVRTIRNSGKVKRIQNNPNVRVAPCEVDGRLRGDWVKGRARLATAAESERTSQLLEEKYGELKRSFEAQTLSQGLEYTVLVIQI